MGEEVIRITLNVMWGKVEVYITNSKQSVLFFYCCCFVFVYHVGVLCVLVHPTCSGCCPSCLFVPWSGSSRVSQAWLLQLLGFILDWTAHLEKSA